MGLVCNSARAQCKYKWASVFSPGQAHNITMFSWLQNIMCFAHLRPALRNWTNSCFDWSWRGNDSIKEKLLPAKMAMAVPNVTRLMKILRFRMGPDELGEPVQEKAQHGVVYRLELKRPLTQKQQDAASQGTEYHHGCKWPATWSILHGRCLHESNDKDKGHNFGDDPGAYVTTGGLGQALGYSRFTMPCGDGVFWAPVVEVLANPYKQRPLSKGKKSGNQRIFASKDTVVMALLVVGRTAKQMEASSMCHLPLEWMQDIEINPTLPH